MNQRPVIAFTLGDVAGIGPEVAVKAALHPDVREICRPMLVGPTVTVKMVAALVNRDIHVHQLVDGSKTPEHPGPTDVYVQAVPLEGKVHNGQHSAASGRAAYTSLLWAIDKTLAGEIEAIVTAPLNKKSLRAAGVQEPGHTEILARRCDVREHAMMLYLPPGDPAVGPNGLAVNHVTLHSPISRVPGSLTVAGIEAKIRLMDTFLKRTGLARPRIGVAALNPHGGEEGLFGDEEERVIRPAIEAVYPDEILADGPLPVDTLFRRAVTGHEFDGIVAMYHDQGHIPLKLIAFDRAVNVTLGLPIVRTSPSHGTAYDIAWTGMADPSGMIAATHTAVMLLRSFRAGLIN